MRKKHELCKVIYWKVVLMEGHYRFVIAKNIPYL